MLLVWCYPHAHLDAQIDSSNASSREPGHSVLIRGEIGALQWINFKRQPYGPGRQPVSLMKSPSHARRLLGIQAATLIQPLLMNPWSSNGGLDLLSDYAQKLESAAGETLLRPSRAWRQSRMSRSAGTESKI
jgi:hypothetical protein